MDSLTMAGPEPGSPPRGAPPVTEAYREHMGRYPDGPRLLLPYYLDAVGILRWDARFGTCPYPQVDGRLLGRLPKTSAAIVKMAVALQFSESRYRAGRGAPYYAMGDWHHVREDYRRAVGTELLPALHNRAGVWQLQKRRWPRVFSKLPGRLDLLDHPWLMSGPGGTVICAEPYVNRHTNQLKPEAMDVARPLIAAGYRVVVSGVLSGHYPGETALVIASKTLDLAAAARLGFEPVCDPPGPILSGGAAPRLA